MRARALLRVFPITLFLVFPLHADLARAHAAMQQSRFAEAAEEYRALVHAEKNNMEAQAGLANALYALARYDEIIALFPEEIRKGNIDLNQRTPEVMAILKNIGFACYRSGQSKRAIVALSVAVRIQDDDPSVYNTLGLAYLNIGSFRLAETTFQTAVNLAPASPFYVNNLGAAYLEQKQYREALICFEKSVRNDRNYHTGWENIWLSREKLGVPAYRGEYWFSYFITATDEERLAHQRYLDERKRDDDRKKQEAELAVLAAKKQKEEEERREAERLRLEEEARNAALLQQNTNQSPPEPGATDAPVLPPEDPAKASGGDAPPAENAGE